MFTRYLGGGIGHKVTENHDIQPIIYKRAHEKDTETQEGVGADHTAGHTEPLDECDERDSEGIDTDEELEGYYNNGDSAIEDSDADQGSTDSDSDHDEETFEDYD